MSAVNIQQAFVTRYLAISISCHSEPAWLDNLRRSYKPSSAAGAWLQPCYTNRLTLVAIPDRARRLGLPEYVCIEGWCMSCATRDHTCT